MIEQHVNYPPNIKKWLNHVLLSSLTPEEALRLENAKTVEEKKELFKEFHIIRYRGGFVVYRKDKLCARCTYNSDDDEVQDEILFAEALATESSKEDER